MFGTATCGAGATVEKMRQLAKSLYPGRIVPAATPYAAFQEAASRYAFAAQFVRGRSVLDLACGTGMGTSFLLSAGAKRVVGVDISRESVEVGQGLYRSCLFVVGDGISLPFPPSSFDVVVSFETIEHVPDHGRFIEACHNVLRHSGTFVCSTPNFSVSRFAPNPYHEREFRADEFRSLLESQFGRVAIFGQSEVNLLRYVPLRTAVALLEGVGLKGTMKKVLRPRGSSLVPAWAFGAVELDSRYCVKRFQQGWMRKPTYIITVAEKL